VPVVTGPGVRRDDVGRERDSASSRHEMSELLKATRPRNREGAGKAGCPPHPWSACNKKHAAEPQVQADPPAFPAQWLYGLYVIFPVTMLGCHRHPAGHDLARLSACIGAPEPHDFAVRTHAARRAKIAPGDVRPSHPAPNVRDDREPPLFLGCGMGESIVLICPTTQCRGRATDWHDGQCRILGQTRLLIVGAPRAFPSSLSKIGSEGFLHAGLDDPNQIERDHEMNFCAQAILVELMGDLLSKTTDSSRANYWMLTAPWAVRDGWRGQGRASVARITVETIFDVR
jgi:hypothetical protein